MTTFQDKLNSFLEEINELLTKKNKEESTNKLIEFVSDAELVNDYGFVTMVIGNLPTLAGEELIDGDKVIKALAENIQSPEKIKDSFSGLSIFSGFCQTGNLDMVKLFAPKVSNFEEPDKIGCTPVYHACMSGNLAIVKLLHDVYSISLSFKDKYNETLLHAASASGNLELINFLQENKLDPDLKELRHNLNCLSTAAYHANNPDVLKALEDNGASYNTDNSYELSPINLSILMNQYDNVTYFIETGHGDELPYDVSDIKTALSFISVENTEKRNTKEWRETAIKGTFAEYVITKAESAESVLKLITDYEQVKEIARLFNTTPIEFLKYDFDESLKNQIKIAIMI